MYTEVDYILSLCSQYYFVCFFCKISMDIYIRYVYEDMKSMKCCENYYNSLHALASPILSIYYFELCAECLK